MNCTPIKIDMRVLFEWKIKSHSGCMERKVSIIYLISNTLLKIQICNVQHDGSCIDEKMENLYENGHSHTK